MFSYFICLGSDTYGLLISSMACGRETNAGRPIDTWEKWVDNFFLPVLELFSIYFTLGSQLYSRPASKTNEFKISKIIRQIQRNSIDCYKLLGNVHQIPYIFSHQFQQQQHSTTTTTFHLQNKTDDHILLMQTLAQLGQSIWSRQLATLGLGSRTTCSNTSTTDDESCTHALNVSDQQSIRSEANKEPGVNHPVATSANWQAQAGSRDTEPISSSTGPTRHFSAELICGSIDRPEVWMQRRQRSSRCRGTDPRGWPWTLSHRREPMAGAGGFRMKRDGGKVGGRSIPQPPTEENPRHCVKTKGLLHARK